MPLARFGEALTSPVGVAPSRSPHIFQRFCSPQLKFLFPFSPTSQVCTVMFFYFKLLFKDSLTGLRYLQSGLAPDSSALDNWKWDLSLYQGTVPRADNPKRVPLHEYLAPITSSNCLLVGNRNLKIPLLKCTTQRSITSPLSIGSMSRSHSTMTSVKTKVCCPERSPSATSGFYGE